MANKTIDQLTANATLAGTELLPLWQSSATVKLDLAELRVFARNSPHDTEASGRALTTADVNKTIKSTSGALPDFTIPDATFASEDVVYFINASSNPMTVTPDGGFTLYLSPGAVAPGVRTIPARGFATLYFTSASEAYLTGVSCS